MGVRRKLPQAKAEVAKRTSHGTKRVKMVTGVLMSNSAPSAPPTQLMRNRCRKRICPTSLSRQRPAIAEVIWLGKSATHEVMLADRGFNPNRINDGRVMKEPPPARTF